MFYDITIAGFGGQGVMLTGNILATAAMNEGKYVTYWPSYSAEMRGGTANCSVIISDREIGSPIIASPSNAIIMNLPSLLKYGLVMSENGLLIVNTSLIGSEDIVGIGVGRDDLNIVEAPLISLAAKAGNSRCANMVALGILLSRRKLVELDFIFNALEIVLDKRYHRLIPVNKKAIQIGIDFTKSRRK